MNKLKDRCAETLSAALVANVGNAVVLGGSITAPYYSQTFADAYNTEAGQSISRLPISIDEGMLWQTGFATYDHDNNSLTIASISESSAGGSGVTFTSAARVMIDMLADMPFATVETISPTGLNDDLIINEASEYLYNNGGGKIVLTAGEFDLTNQCDQLPNVWIEGAGAGATKMIIPTGTNTFAAFGFNANEYGFVADQENWGVSELSIDGYSSTSGCQAISTKASFYNMTNAKIKNVDAAGFSFGDLIPISTPAIHIGDPRGCVMRGMNIKDTGPRTVVHIQGGTGTANGLIYDDNKIENYTNIGLHLEALATPKVINSSFTGDQSGVTALYVSGSGYGTFANNLFEGISGTAIELADVNGDHQLLGNVAYGFNVAGSRGLVIGSSSFDTNVVGGTFDVFENDITDNGINTTVSSVRDANGIVNIPALPPGPEVHPVQDVSGAYSGTVSIRPGANRITITLSNVRSGSSGVPVLRVAEVDGIPITTGYFALAVHPATSGTITTYPSSTGIPLFPAPVYSNSQYFTGKITLTRLDADQWVYDSQVRSSQTVMGFVTGRITMTSELRYLQYTSNSSSLTMTSGEIGVMVE